MLELTVPPPPPPPVPHALNHWASGTKTVCFWTSSLSSPPHLSLSSPLLPLCTPPPPTPTRLQTAHHSINGSHSSTYTCMCVCECVCPESVSVDSLHYRRKHVIGCAANLVKVQQSASVKCCASTAGRSQRKNSERL